MISKREAAATLLLKLCKKKQFSIADFYNHMINVVKSLHTEESKKLFFDLKRLKTKDSSLFQSTIENFCRENIEISSIADLLAYSLMSECDIKFYQQVCASFLKQSQVQNLTLVVSSEQNLAAIKSIVKEIVDGQECNVQIKIDPSLISGWVIYFNNVKHDNSTLGKIEKIHKNLIK